MFERFTDTARRLVVHAQEEARGLNHGYIGTEHLLLGALREGEGVAARVLAGLGTTLDGTRAAIVELVGRGADAPAGHIPFTPRAKKALELSLREAQSFGHSYISTEHILLGLVGEGDGVAAQYLRKAVDYGRIRAATVEMMGVAPQPSSEAPAAGATVAGPRCPHCRDATTAWTSTPVVVDAGDGTTASYTVLWCRTCGRTISAQRS